MPAPAPSVLLAPEPAGAGPPGDTVKTLIATITTIVAGLAGLAGAAAWLPALASDAAVVHEPPARAPAPGPAHAQ